jgi:hypothetical protein
MELEAQMATGFSSLDNRLTMMSAMFEQDRLDRLARQKEKDQRKTADLSPYTKTRNQESGTQPTQPQRRSETEVQKNNNQTMIPPIKIIQWNARGLYRSRLEEFKNHLRNHNTHIVLLSETH